MTVIASYKDESGVYIGTDTACSDDSETQIYGEKLIYHKNFILAFSGSIRTAQILEYAVDEVRCNPKTRHDVISVAEYFKLLLTDNGNIIEKNKTSEMDAFLILATYDNIFCIQEDFAVLEYKDTHFASGGSGGYVALGVLAGREDEHGEIDKPRELLTLAINKAIKYVPSCGGNAVVRKVCRDNRKYREKP